MKIGTRSIIAGREGGALGTGPGVCTTRQTADCLFCPAMETPGALAIFTF